LKHQNHEKNTSKEKQPILPFSKKANVKHADNIFKLPVINFLEKNQDLKNKKKC